MKRLLAYIFIIFSFANLTKAIELDLVQYKYKDGHTLLELNYQMKAASLLFAKDTSGAFVANVELQFIVSSAGVQNINNSWLYSYTKMPNDSGVTIFDKRYFSIYPGQYDFKLIATIAGNKFQHIEGKILVKDFSKKETSMSDILLAHQISDFDSLKNNELFRKHKLYIIPNIEHTINGLYSTINYYYELYHIDTSKTDKISVGLSISTGDGKKVFETEKGKTVISSSIYDYGLIPLDTLKNGVYNFEISIKQKNKQIANQHTKFYILDTNRAFYESKDYVENISFERSPFSIMTDDKIAYEFETMKPILTEYEIEKYHSLNSLRARQRAIFNYWQSRDTDTSTTVNEYMSEYQKRVEFASQFFSRGNIMPGWKSERGRVLLKYGFPTNREIYRAKSDKNAAEDWQYDDLYGGCYFIFVDKFGDNSFQLVHSSAPNEIKNYNWYEEFKPAIENDGNPKYNNSRADDK
jgi:GWxTD domain-containing protein